ncbi:MAG: serine/threonine-protein phosphatase, partial [Lachnospiraceae bacterium]|nr:serine/threonine-protein phosphatase [Lachnospiraceae bacterium]MBD9157809.1 serine/threonine-protein phosphatase [Lachnospiraceae bacterium]
DTVEPDYFDTDLQKGECLLMCSDGLTNMVSDRRIKEIVELRTDLESCAKELIRAANQNGGRDNIAVVLIERV